jgi:DnaJ-class molecular chaperone
MNMRQSRRLKAHASARLQHAHAYSEHMHAQAALDAECFTDDGSDRDDGGIGPCRTCDGDGRDKWNDYAMECPHCGGTGREGW